MSNSQSIQNIKIPYATEGIIRSAQLDDTISPKNSVQIAVNMNFDRVGAIQTRRGVQNFGGDFPFVASPLDVLSMASLQIRNQVSSIAEYSETNQNGLTSLFYGVVIADGQSFQVPRTCILNSCKFYIKKIGTPPGNITASIYLSTGTLGTTSKPTGSVLATSLPIIADSLTTSLQLITFNFTSTERITLSALTNYVIVINYNDGDASNCVSVGIDNTSSYSGNWSASGDLVSWSPISGNSLCFYVYGFFPSGSNYLYTQIGNTYLVYDQNTWTNIGSVGIANKARWSQFLNYIWRVNGTNNTPVMTSNGGSFGTTLVPAGFPSGDYISGGFEGRVWVADAVNDVIYYTDIVQFTPPNTYSLTFDINKNFIQNFSPQDGETFTGLFRVPRALLAFKQNHIYRIYGATSVDSYPAYNVGTYSQESIVQTKDGIYFHHSSGFYQFNYDGQPTEISRRIIDFVQAIPLSKYSSIVGIWDQFDNVSWSIGTVTVEGVTFNNCVVRYTISTQVWTIYDYAGKSINSMVVYNDGTSIKQLIGTVASTVVNNVIGQLDTGFDDFGSPIYYEFIDRWRPFTDMYAKSKSISGVNLYSENAAGANLFYQIQKDTTNDWNIIGTVDEGNMSLFPNANTDDFEVARLRLAGFSKGTPVIVHGIEILSINDKGYNEN